jgi:hypothetical protein
MTNSLHVSKTVQQYHAERGEELIALTLRQRDTIIAALRLWQTRELGAACYNAVHLNAIASEHGDKLDVNELDELCQLVSFGT